MYCHFPGIIYLWYVLQFKLQRRKSASRFCKKCFFCRKSDIHLDIGTQVQLCGLRRSVVATGDGERLVLGRVQEEDPQPVFSVMSTLSVGTNRSSRQETAWQQTRRLGNSCFLISTLVWKLNLFWSLVNVVSFLS